MVIRSELQTRISSLQKTLAIREDKYNQDRQKELEDLHELDEQENASIHVEKSEESSSSKLASEIEILEGEEKQCVLDDEYDPVDGKIALKLRSTADEENVVVIRMPSVCFLFFSSSFILYSITHSQNCPFDKLITSLGAIGFPKGKVMFDCNALQPDDTPQVQSRL